jgi:hypothetical protein
LITGTSSTGENAAGKTTKRPPINLAKEDEAKSSDSSQNSPSQAAYSYVGLQEALMRINEPDD